eukprot:scaffold76012_cov52-Attheya_sp.AAC.2
MRRERVRGHHGIAGNRCNGTGRGCGEPGEEWRAVRGLRGRIDVSGGNPDMTAQSANQYQLHFFSFVVEI